MTVSTGAGRRALVPPYTGISRDRRFSWASRRCLRRNGPGRSIYIGYPKCQINQSTGCKIQVAISQFPILVKIGFMRDQLSWESICLTSRGSAVRARHGAPRYIDQSLTPMKSNCGRDAAGLYIYQLKDTHSKPQQRDQLSWLSISLIH